MKSLLVSIVAAVLVVGCAPQPPDISIHDAAYRDIIEAVKQHMAAGTDVNEKDEDGWTPLNYAAFSGCKEVAELLIAKGADVNAMVLYGGIDDAFGNKIPYDDGGFQLTPITPYSTPLDLAQTIDKRDAPEIKADKKATANLIRKHGGKTAEELKAEGK